MPLRAPEESQPYHALNMSVKQSNAKVTLLLFSQRSHKKRGSEIAKACFVVVQTMCARDALMRSSIEKSIAIPASQSTSITIADRLPVFAVLLVGLVMLYSVGFSSMSPVHNATHDTRHANGFPCH